LEESILLHNIFGHKNRISRLKKLAKEFCWEGGGKVIFKAPLKQKIELNENAA